MNRYFAITLKVLIVLFALIGVTFTAVFIAMQFGLLNVRGSILERNAFFTGSGTNSASVEMAQDTSTSCPGNASTCTWQETREWAVVSGGLEKDVAVINDVSSKTGVPSRLIASVVVPEQMRFFTSEREVFKRYFEPLKILGSLSQFSLGVSGIKQETANKIEQYASDPSSPFYPGDGYATLLAYQPGTDHDAELYKRLTDPKNHYYSYLYTALFIKEIEAQWERAGYPISNKSDIVATLFNIGFENSVPKTNPQVAGAVISVGGTDYPFGALASTFYLSTELTTQFPAR